MSYSPLKVTGNSTGLVQEREEFLLPDDAYPTLQNAFIFRERILRRNGLKKLGRLQRNFSNTTIASFSSAGAGNVTVNLFTLLSIPETNPTFVLGNLSPITITIGAPISQTLTDTTGTGVMTITPAGVITAATINYATGNLTLTFSGAAGASVTTITISYYPNLPSMGIRTREKANSAFDVSIFFDTTYAYDYNSGAGAFEEFLPGTTWNASNSDFFWSTNYFTDSGGNKIFWVTNYSTDFTDNPIRYTNGQTTWYNFAPQIDASLNLLISARVLLPFRGRLVAFNTAEGPNALSTTIYSNRIRWAAIGTPFTTTNAIITSVNQNAWRDDIRGQGGFLNIPTSEDIVAVGFVRDNLVIYCENSTWQLRYTGRSIAPFQIEKVNSELGAMSTFSAVQFDTSLVGIGDKGIVECDSFKSELIDVKIPDFVFKFQNNNNGQDRVHGIRDFVRRIAYWTFCSASANGIFPDSRLIYNYDNDSWAIFSDSLTCLGVFQAQNSPRWIDIPLPWIECNFPWINNTNTGVPLIAGGNQQGYIMLLDQPGQTTNDPSLFIYAISGNTPSPNIITSPNHNLQTGQIISISGIPMGTPFSNLNGMVFMVIVIDANTFTMNSYDSLTQEFDIPQADSPGIYIGGGEISVRDNFNITSKKFNFLDEGQNIQLGYIDILMSATESENPGAISLNVYLDYNDDEAINTLPQNAIDPSAPTSPDTFFNSIIPTSPSDLNTTGGTKFWQRVYCPSRGNFLTLQYTLSNAQMNGIEQESPVQIDAQVLWLRKAGRMTQI